MWTPQYGQHIVPLFMCLIYGAHKDDVNGGSWEMKISMLDLGVCKTWKMLILTLDLRLSKLHLCKYLITSREFLGIL